MRMKISYTLHILQTFGKDKLKWKTYFYTYDCRQDSARMKIKKQKNQYAQIQWEE